MLRFASHDNSRSDLFVGAGIDEGEGSGEAVVVVKKCGGGTSFALRREVIAAASRAVVGDSKVTGPTAALVQVISVALDCPAPLPAEASEKNPTWQHDAPQREKSSAFGGHRFNFKPDFSRRENVKKP